MKKKIILLVTILLLAFTNAYAQLTYPPISVGNLLDWPEYSRTHNTADYPMGYFHHAIILTVPMDVVISHCGSTLNASNLSIYDNNLNLIANGRSAAEVGCSNANLKYLRINNLAPGTYFIKSEFTDFNAQIKVSIDSSPGTNPVGNSRTNPIDVGQKSNSFIYTDTKNTNDFTNDYNGQPTNDVFYRLSITIPMDVDISHYGSVVTGTIVYLLDENGRLIANDNSYSGMNCDKIPNTCLKMTALDAGVYYIVSEGFNTNGSITTAISGTARGGGSDNNYILTITPTVATSDVSTLSADDALRTYRYFDGLGRPMQTVQQRATPDKSDLVSFQEYDAFGRESNSWLPAKATTSTGAFVPLPTVETRSAATYADPKAYSTVAYEASPLSRVTGQTGPGADWHYNGKKVDTEYLTNNDTYVCRWYRVSDTRTNSQVSITSGEVNYTAGELYVTKLTDEDENVSYEFKNKLGQVLLTRQMEGNVAHDTYYIYDSYGNLRAVLPPLAADAMTAAGSWAETHATIMNYAYLYKYDGRNRCIAKKFPGAEWVYYVYDYSDQLIFTQDGEMRAKTPKQWMFSFPDIFGREALTGTCTNEMDYAANPLGNNVVRAMRYYGNNPYNGYAYVGTSLINPVILTTAYYDNYRFMGSNGMPNSTDADFKYEPLSGYGTQYTDGHTGLLTGTMKAQMNADGVITSYLYSVMYYDDRGRVIQVKSSNHLAGGVDKEYIAYNFSGQPVKRRLVHSATGKATQTQLYEYSYDHARRLTQVKHGLNTSTAGTVIALNTYDDLGRLKTQKKGSLPETTYGYNVRSWTKTIANNTLFSQTLYYNENYSGSTKKYGGNVSATSWKVGSETLRGYAFAYDGLSRLTSASYLLGGVVNSNNSVSGITYDKHGNMRTIQRRGKITASTYGVIDNLTMAYSGNQLTGVTDVGSTVTLAESNDFKKGSTAATQYFYNRNGAMDKDLNKNISDISYNLLNLPSKVTIAGVAHKYTYSADGRKLRVEQGTTNRDYVGSVIYENGSLKRVLIDGGYIEGGVYYYYLNDHLGNVRVVASGTGTVHQKNEYYPFGMPMAETANSQQDVQPYKFGGKEFERKNGLNLYDFEARQMDPAIGRFTMMDPLAEKYYSVSPYAYCGNNPMRYIDPTGMTHYSMGSDGRVSIMMGDNNYPLGAADSYDMLFIGNASTIILDQTIMPQLMQENRKGYKGSYAETYNRIDAFNIFYFAATFTNVEWGLDGYRSLKGNKYVLRTSHEEGKVAQITNIPGYNVFDQIFTMHSHPGKDGTKGASTKESVIDGQLYHDGDMRNIIISYENFENAGMKTSSQWFKKDGQWTVFPKHYIFHPHSGTLYNYTPWDSSIYIRNVNKSSDLYRNLGF